MELDRIAEGLCPKHSTRLEVREANGHTFGWCDACDRGYSINGGESFGYRKETPADIIAAALRGE